MRTAAVLLLVAMTFVGLGCDSDDVVDVRIGSMEITTRTTGPSPDPDGYQVRIFGSGFDLTQSIDPNDTVTLSLVAERSYTVSLSDVAANCSVDLDPQSVGVSTNSTVPVLFNVSCP